ncbi:GTPase [Gordonia sp. 'Campus']|uniref:GTPase n=1 Tax=Gordonia sp. 'Campus' TaxID=2915824 RepID=UPI001EE3E9DE|nr:GTPase [Gordonia sp. 'Campus']
MEHNHQGLQQAVDRAVRSGEHELAQLERSVATTLARFESASAAATDTTEGPAADLSQFTTDFEAALRGHLDAQRDRLATFNIAFFGRTGAGKSTLLSAFGELDGGYVSPGDSDWTTDVTEIEWQGCSLWDTPGINGWGRTQKRAQLEETARRAVEIADVVLLCFDNQSQQASEFGKVAQWVQAYGKPTIAVLNVRNLRWRHPAKVSSQSARRSLSRAVAEHANNIRTELTKIDLGSTPIVATQSRRALFARAKTPFVGPAESDFTSDREKFGTDYLAEWSNFSVLEELITASIEEGGAELRQTSLREGLREIFDSRASVLAGILDGLTPQLSLVENRIDQLFDTLGYPEGDDRDRYLGVDGRLIPTVEAARGKPFTAGPVGTLGRQFDHLMQSHLMRVREATLRRADDLVSTAIDTNTPLTDDDFRSVYSPTDLQTAVEEIWKAKGAFLQRTIELAMSQVVPDVVDSTTDGVTFESISGASSRAGLALQAAGLAAGAAAGVIAVPSIATIWNPVGWVGTTTAIGLSAVGQLGKYAGQKLAKRGENERAAARSAIERESRLAVHKTFDSIEKDLREQSASETWDLAGPVLVALLKQDLALRRSKTEIANLIDVLHVQSGGIAPSFAGVDVLEKAVRRVLNSRPTSSKNEASILLGEDWFEHNDERSSLHGELTDAHRAIFAEEREQERRQLREWLSHVWQVRSQSEIDEWMTTVNAFCADDLELADAIRKIAATEHRKPSVVILGDYSAGKSSLVKRLLVEMSGSVPEDLQIRGSVATSSVRTYELDHIRLIDTPGFQSGQASHDEQALGAVAGAALVLVVVHVNLLIGDLSLLETIVKGTETAVSKRGRVLYLINRSDELGTDPTSAPIDYLLLRRRKAGELIAALASRDILVDPAEVHALAGDPFGEVGSRMDVTRTDFDSNRDWDGVEPLARTLDTFSGRESHAGRTRARVDEISATLMRRRNELRQTTIPMEPELAAFGRTIEAIENGERDAELLETSLRNRFKRILQPRADTARHKVSAAGKDDMARLEEFTDEWLRDEDLLAEIDRFVGTAAQDIDRWFAKHTSIIGRQMKSVEFAAGLSLGGEERFVGPAEGGSASDVVAGSARNTAKVAKAIGNRDAIYAIGKSLGVKFKPWGAVKAGGRVAKAAPILAAIATAADAHAMYKGHKSGKDREQSRNGAIEFITKASQTVETQILHGDRRDGPIPALRERAAVLAEHRRALQQEQAAVSNTLQQTRTQIDGLTGLLVSASELFSQERSAS